MLPHRPRTFAYRKCECFIFRPVQRIFSVSQSENTARPIRFEHYITWPEQLLLSKRSTQSVLPSQKELGYFNTLMFSAGSDPNNVIFIPWNATFIRGTPPKNWYFPLLEYDFLPGDPPLKSNWATFGLVLSSNWAGFAEKTLQPWTRWR